MFVGLCTPFCLRLLQHMVLCCHVIGWTLLKIMFCVHRFFYSFTASDGSEGTTTGRVVSPCSIMMHHGFRGKKVRRAGKEDIDYSKQRHSPHCWLPTKVMFPAN